MQNLFRKRKKKNIFKIFLSANFNNSSIKSTPVILYIGVFLTFAVATTGHPSAIIYSALLYLEKTFSLDFILIM